MTLSFKVTSSYKVKQGGIIKRLSRATTCAFFVASLSAGNNGVWCPRQNFSNIHNVLDSSFLPHLATCISSNFIYCDTTSAMHTKLRKCKHYRCIGHDLVVGVRVGDEVRLNGLEDGSDEFLGFDDLVLDVHPRAAACALNPPSLRCCHRPPAPPSCVTTPSRWTHQCCCP